MSGSETLLKKLPSAVNMSVLVKLVVRPTAASAAKSPGESASCVTSDGKRHTCFNAEVATFDPSRPGLTLRLVNCATGCGHWLHHLQCCKRHVPSPWCVQN